MKKTANFPHSFVTILKISFTIVGTIIGAGFASGKEASTFLGVYGNFTYIACIIFGFCFCIGTIYFSNLSYKLISPLLHKCINVCILISEFISIVAMMAGLRAIFDMLFINATPYYISLILIFLIIISGLNGLTTTNLILVPIIVISIAIFGFLGYKTAPNLNLTTTNCEPIFRTLSLPLYIGMNLFSVLPIALEFSNKQSKKEKIWTAIISSSLLTALLLCFCFTILNVNNSTINSELPLIIFILDFAPNFILLAIVTLAIAIITTIVSDGFVVHSLIKSKVKKCDNLILLAVFIVAFLISRLGFSNIVEKLYPITGIIGTALTITLIVLGIANNSHKKAPLKTKFNAQSFNTNIQQLYSKKKNS